MSFVKDIKHSVNINRVPAQLAIFEKMIDEAEPCFELDGIGLETACKRHAQNLMNYDIMLQECVMIEETVRARMEEIESELYKKFNENYQRALGARDIQQYIKGDAQYVQIYEILLEVSVVKKKLEAVVESLKSMGWMLGHITKLRVAQLDHVTL